MDVLMEEEGSLLRAIFSEEVTTTVTEIAGRTLAPIGPILVAVMGLKIRPVQIREVDGRGPAIDLLANRVAAVSILARTETTEITSPTAVSRMAVRVAVVIYVVGLAAIEGYRGLATRKALKVPNGLTT